MKTKPNSHFRSILRLLACGLVIGGGTLSAEDKPARGDAKRLDLGGTTALEVVFIPPGEFMMGSTPEEKAWAQGVEGGVTLGSFFSSKVIRESYEGERPRLTRVPRGFWMGRTEVTVGQFRRFAEESGFVTDAEQPGGESQVFDPDWDGYHLTTKTVHPWKSVKGKSWRDPNWAFPNREDFPVVCVSYNDMKAFCRWLTQREEKAGRLPDGFEYRLPTEAEWEYACRGGSKESLYFWWGNELEDGQGRLNLSGLDLLPGRTKAWPLAKAPWSDGFAFVSPVDHYGARGRNGFGLADMCGGVWEFVIDHFDPKGAHEEIHYEDPDKRTVSRPVCRSGNYFDVPGNARCAVRLGIRSVTYSDSRDGFRVCLGHRVADATETSKPGTTGSAGFSETPGLAAARREMRNRQRRIIFNDDGCGPFWVKDGGNTLERYLRGPHSRLGAVVDTQVDSVFICSGATHVLNHPSTVAEDYADNTEKYADQDKSVANYWRVRDNMRALEALGTDAIRLTVEFCKENRKEVFYSFRANDLHLAQGGGFNNEKSTWWREHPHYWLGKPANLTEQDAMAFPATDPRRWGWAALNFELPEVRDYLLRILEEVAGKYDLDGIEIDYLRAPLFFLPNLEKKPATASQLDILTDFQRQVRLIALRAGEKRGRPMLVAARVPATGAQCRHVGIDIPRWLQDDLVDVVSLGGGYMPLNGEWPELTALGRARGVPVYPVLSDSGFRGPYKDIETWRAAAANAYQAGARGVYLFNHFPNQASPHFRELGDPKSLASLDKVFVVENDPDGYWGHFMCLLDSLAAKDARTGTEAPFGIKPSGRFLPMTLEPSGENVVFLTIGDDLAKAAAGGKLAGAELKVRLGAPNAVNSVTVSLNGAPLTAAAKDAAEGWLSFTPPAGAFKTGRNRVSFRVPPGSGAPVEVRAVEAHVKYKR